MALNNASIPGIFRASIIAFSYREPDHDTEALILVYGRAYEPDDNQSRVETHIAISKSVTLLYGVRPHKIIPLRTTYLQKSALGKISRAKFRKAFENGEYLQLDKSQSEALEIYKQSDHEAATTQTEKAIIDVYLSIFPDMAAEMRRNTDLFAIGLSSIDILKIQSGLQTQLSIPDIPLTALFAHHILHELASALDTLRPQFDYEPVVVLQPNGEKTPLWLIHPGVGEVLVFMNLARHFSDRPVYALRSRGFNSEPFFSSVAENISVFHDAIKSRQPSGPYAIAGYSFGAVLAFEVAKVMERNGDEVRFLATLDQAPYFKARAQSYTWTEVLLYICAFLRFIKEEEVLKLLPEASKLEREAILEDVLNGAPKARVLEMNMTKAKLGNWADLAFQLKKNSADYDPVGTVSKMDAFYTEPLVGLVEANTVSATPQVLEMTKRC